MEKIKQDLIQFISPFVPKLSEKALSKLISPPKNKAHGSLSFCVFSLHPKAVDFAKDLSDKLNQSKPSFIDQIEPLSGFINFHFTDEYIQKIFSQTFMNGWGCDPKEGQGQTWIIDYSSPNVAKYMNIGHFRATMIGQAVVNMALSRGYKVVALNYLGDWGTQFGKLITAYQKWGKKEYDLSHLIELYVRFHETAQKEDSLNEQARRNFKKLEEGDPELLQLWSSFVKVSMEHYQKIWKKLNVQHNLIQGESFFKDKVGEVEKFLSRQKILEESEGAQVVFLEDKTPPCLIRKKDGASTYAGRDLAGVFYRFEKLKAHKNIYITGVDQTLHFKQIKSVLKKARQIKWAENTIHLSFGMYRFEGQGKLSSREGQTISLSDLMDTACSKILQIISQKNPDLENKKSISEDIGIGALIFNDLKNDRIKDVDFSWSQILNFDGNSGPYVQYCHVRCASLLKKAKVEPTEWTTLKALNMKKCEPLERDLILTLLHFESSFQQAFTQFKPHILANYLLELCRVFSRFYKEYRIIDSEKQEERLTLVKAVKKVLYKGLSLLNIKAPSAM